MIRRTAVVVLYLPPANQYMFKSATKTLKIIENISNQNIFNEELPYVFYKKSVLKYLAKFIREHLYKSLFFNKAAYLRPTTLLTRDSGKSIFLRVLQNF